MLLLASAAAAVPIPDTSLCVEAPADWVPTTSPSGLRAPGGFTVTATEHPAGMFAVVREGLPREMVRGGGVLESGEDLSIAGRSAWFGTFRFPGTLFGGSPDLRMTMLLVDFPTTVAQIGGNSFATDSAAAALLDPVVRSVTVCAPPPKVFRIKPPAGYRVVADGAFVKAWAAEGAEWTARVSDTPAPLSLAGARALASAIVAGATVREVRASDLVMHRRHGFIVVGTTTVNGREGTVVVVMLDLENGKHAAFAGFAPGPPKVVAPKFERSARSFVLE